MSTVQLFCTVADLVADKQSAGSDETRMLQAIREASNFIEKEIGWFIPVTLTRRYNGLRKTRLFVQPLLAITSIQDGAGTAAPVTLTTDDYILKPDARLWPDGPFTYLVVDPDSTRLSAWYCRVDGVAITGRWGKYERSALIGATVQDTTEQSSSQTTLKVSDGGKVSPGMILKIGDEQEAVTGWGDPTAAVTTLAANVAATDETITVANGSLVNTGEIIRTTFEQMKVKDKQTNVLEVTRSWNGTRRVAHTSGANVDVYRTVNVERAVNGTTASAHANATAISRYLVPDDVLLLCKEIATLSVNKALSGYQGRTGNQETGVITYYDVFPKYDIMTVKKNYRIPRI